MIAQFEDSSIFIKDQDSTATRAQLQELYNTPRKTLADNIIKLKSDGLITGRKTAQLTNDGKSRTIELFDLAEIIAIGFRLRSDKAIVFQRWSIEVIKKQFLAMKEKYEMQQMQLDYYEDKDEINKLYNK